MFLQELKHVPAISNGRSVNDTLGLVQDLLKEIAEKDLEATEVALAYANLGSLLGWRRARRRMSEYRQNVSKADKVPKVRNP